VGLGMRWRQSDLAPSIRIGAPCWHLQTQPPSSSSQVPPSSSLSLRWVSSSTSAFCILASAHLLSLLRSHPHSPSHHPSHRHSMSNGMRESRDSGMGYYADHIDEKYPYKPPKDVDPQGVEEIREDGSSAVCLVSVNRLASIHSHRFI
jgi:hypothetical protein